MIEDNADYEAWLASRPPAIQDLARRYPTGWYRVKEAAPYRISAPGTVVELIGYRETGDVIIAVWATDMVPEGLEHMRRLCENNNKDYETHCKLDHRVHVDPIWLVPCEPPLRP